LGWVAWQGVGFGAEAHVVLDELDRLGSRPVTAEEAFAAWEHVDRYDVAQAVMVPLPSGPGPGAGAGAGGAAGRDWSVLSAQDVLGELEMGLRAIVARELRVPEAELDTERPFAEMGLNSVMAMSVRRAAEQLVGIELSATMLWNHPTIASLTAYLAHKLVGQHDSDSDTESLIEEASSVLNELFDHVESAPSGIQSGI
jgi:phthiocerol/phenolphthiocerol synthesis type-I polyketide synthase A